MEWFGSWTAVTLHKNNEGSWFEGLELREGEDVQQFPGLRRNICNGATESLR